MQKVTITQCIPSVCLLGNGGEAALKLKRET